MFNVGKGMSTSGVGWDACIDNTGEDGGATCPNVAVVGVMSRSLR